MNTRVPFNDLQRDVALERSNIESAIDRVVSSGWFVLGPENESLEAELATYVGIAHAIAVANGTDALTIALRAIGVEPGDRVITVANAGGYATTAILEVDAVPAYCDVEPETLLISTASARETAEALHAGGGSWPRCIIVTHLYGQVAEIHELVSWARERGIAVLEDCAQAMGARSGDHHVGTVGDVATTSFYPTKNLGALGDAGAIFTDDGQIAARVRQLRQYGWAAKYETTRRGGMNSRCDEMQAAILRARLPLLDSANERRRAIHARYEAALASRSARFVTSTTRPYVGHLAVLQVEDRAVAEAHCASRGVSTQVHYPICDHQQATSERHHVPLEVSEHAADHIVSIPLFPSLREEEIAQVCEALEGMPQ